MEETWFFFISKTSYFNNQRDSNWEKTLQHVCGDSLMSMLLIWTRLMGLHLLSIQISKALTFWFGSSKIRGMYQQFLIGNSPLQVLHSSISVICSATITYTLLTSPVNSYVATRNMEDNFLLA